MQTLRKNDYNYVFTDPATCYLIGYKENF